MNEKIEKAINMQINAEIYSAYLYLAMAAYFDGEGLEGFSNWMKIQAQEEMTHAMKFYRFVFERGKKVELEAIEKPEGKYGSALEVFEAVLKHEQYVTNLINNLYELATEEKDYAFQSMLKWFIDEQVEEEGNAQQIIDQVKLAGEKGPGLFMLDKELGNRVFVDDTQSGSE